MAGDIGLSMSPVKSCEGLDKPGADSHSFPVLTHSRRPPSALTCPSHHCPWTRLSSSPLTTMTLVFYWGLHPVSWFILFANVTITIIEWQFLISQFVQLSKQEEKVSNA